MKCDKMWPILVTKINECHTSESHVLIRSGNNNVMQYDKMWHILVKKINQCHTSELF